MERKGTVLYGVFAVLLCVMALLVGMLWGIRSGTIEAKADAIRENHYWVSSEGTGDIVSKETIDLRLYLEDHGCEDIEFFNYESDDAFEQICFFSKDGAEFILRTKANKQIWSGGGSPSEGHPVAANTVTYSSLIVLFPDGRRLTTAKNMAYYPVSELVYDSETNFACTRACLGQLFYVIQGGVDAETLLERIDEFTRIGMSYAEPRLRDTTPPPPITPEP